MSTLSAPRTRSAMPPVRGRSFILVRDGLWRIVDPSGAVIGYIERQAGVDGDRFSARRVVFATRTRELGLFCRIDDAVDCFR
ncbi:DNA mismatch repair protein [Cryobacterium glaciale]|uniref:DNA mismatch repair protein n=1 Tax=Cryobacterium glaciale TaxID=1259145 RepID=A0A4R8V3R9_9MICO|nr:DNA mismatch repair protein [Cryobacterium glaciale]TFB76468.1 DNA mismatch repair protein [Cryobacterium glaciale]